MGNRIIRFKERDIDHYKVYFSEEHENNYEIDQFIFNRKTSSEAVYIKLEYLSIESELLESFKYVLPVKKNLHTVSEKYANIIKNSANLFERLARKMYSDLFVVQASTRLNIIDYLKLDVYLKLTDEVVICNLLHNEFGKSLVFEPFHELKSWDKTTESLIGNTPEWWNANNQIKHNYDGILEHATFENAFRALAATYVMIKRVYGSGVVGGKLLKPFKLNEKELQEHLDIQGSKLFYDMTGSLAFGY